MHIFKSKSMITIYILLFALLLFVGCDFSAESLFAQDPVVGYEDAAPVFF